MSLKNLNTVYEKDREGRILENLQMYDSFDGGECLYFSALERNGLFRYEKGTGETHFVLWFENEAKDQKHIHRNVIEHADKLFFIPHFGSHIHIIDLGSFQQSSIRVDNDGNGAAKYSNSFLIEDEIWIVPSYLNKPFIVLNIVTYEIKHLDMLGGGLSSLSGIKMPNFDICCSAKWGKGLVLAVMDTNVLLFINTRKQSVEVHKLRCDIHIRSIFVEGDYIWLSLIDELDVVRLRANNGEETRFFADEKKKKEFPVVTLCRIGDVIVSLGGYDDGCWMLDELNRRVVRIDMTYDDAFSRINEDYALFTCVKQESDDEYWLLPRGGNRLIVLNQNRQVIDERKICLNDVENTFDSLLDRDNKGRAKSIIRESRAIGLEALCQMCF